MAMEISGKIIQIMPEQTGSGKNGQWTRQDFVIETQEQFPRKVCFSAWGEKAALVKNLKPDMMVNVSFNAESREFNGKWYTDLRMWKIDMKASQSETPTIPNHTDLLEPLSPGELSSEPDDLPF